MNYLRETKLVIALAEQVSGKPVVVQADAGINLLATVRMARAGAPAHLVLFNPSAASFADYIICYQCGFIIRTYTVSEAERFDVVGNYWGRKEAGKALAEHLRKPGSRQVPREMRDGLRDQMYDGLIRQLRSIPIGLRVDDWIHAAYPDLADQQRAAVVKQLNDNTGVMRPEVRQIAPSSIYDANMAMNGAFAHFWARAWSDELVTSAYRASGYSDAGLSLLSAWDAIPTNPAQDRTLIETWAQQLGISQWFDFAPFPS